MGDKSKKTRQTLIKLFKDAPPKIKLIAFAGFLIQVCFSIGIASIPKEQVIYAFLFNGVIIVAYLYFIYKSFLNDNIIVNPIEQSTTPSDSNIITLKDIKEIRKQLEHLYKFDSPPSKIMQTYIHNNTIHPIRDLVNKYLNLPPENKPDIDRIFLINYPSDIYFVAHNLEFEKKYGEELMSITIFPEDSSIPFHKVYPNFTIIDNHLLLSYPKRKDKLSYDAGILNEKADKSSGIIIKDAKAVGESKEYLTYLKERINKSKSTSNESILQNKKKLFWNSDRLEYLRAIALSIAKEIGYTKELKDNIEFIGIVGSVADNNLKRVPNDLDLVIALKELSESESNIIQSVVNNVLKSYDLNDIGFESSYVAAPIINLDVQKSKFPIQILLYDHNCLLDWSPFIAYQRSKYHITLEGKFPQKFDNFTFNLDELIDETYGINTCLEIINSKKMPFREWIPNKSKKLDYKRKRKQLDSKKLYRGFLQYAIKWNTINYICASDSPLNQFFENIDSGINELANAINLSKEEEKIVLSCINGYDEVNKVFTNKFEEVAKKILENLLILR